MTLDDLIQFLADEAADGVLYRPAIERCILLAHDMGLAPKTVEETHILNNLRARVNLPRILEVDDG